jgi:heme-degrading monooxygenase HmoA
MSTPQLTKNVSPVFCTEGRELRLISEGSISVPVILMIQEGAHFTMAHWTVKPGNEEIFLEKWQKFAHWTLNNLRGARWVYMVQDQEQKNKFISFGPWDSPESIDQWRQSSKFKSAFAEFRELCDDIQPDTMREVIHVRH